MQSTIAATWPRSLWADTAPEVPRNPPLAGDVRADVTVIGAGFTGLRAALFLAEAGVSVVVLDAGDVGFGASGRTGGQVNPMMPFNSPDRLREMLGDEVFGRLAKASLGSADELFALIETYQIECQARQKGWLRVLHTDAARRQAEADIVAWNAHGAGMRMVEGEDLHRLSGSRAYRAAVLTPRGGAVHPLRLAQGLARAAAARGVSIHGGSAVLSLERDGGGWVARTGGGAVRSGKVIVATNGYTGDLLPGLKRSLLPLTPIQIATEPLDPEVIDTILPEGHTISDSRRVIMYARREPGNRIVYGSHGRLARDGTVRGHETVRRDAERVFPQLRGARWSHRWGGRIALTEDHLPHLHEPQPGLIAGLGYNGRGVAMSHVMGRVMAERVLGAPPGALPLPATPVADYPMRGVKLLGMGTAVRAMRFMDWLETR